MKAIARRRARGLSVTRAILEVVRPARQGWAKRHWSAYRRDGLEALIDARLPREPKVTRACTEAVQAARLANPKLTIAETLKILQSLKVRLLPSVSTLRNIFRRVDSRRQYTERKGRFSSTQAVDLPYAGGELILAAEVETGVVSALTNEVVKIGTEVLVSSQGQVPEPDAGHRDAHGHFTADYNHERKRKPDEQIASYLRSAAEKAEGQVLSGLRFTHEQSGTIDCKVRMLVIEPMVNGSKGWNGLRAEHISGVEPFTGIAYMPSTLSKFTSALARCDAGPRLLEVLSERSHEVAQERWGEEGAMAALYIDNHAKGVWSSLFTKSGKVSHLNRVMPCITTTYVHSGAGTPLLVLVQSGAAPLAPRLLEIVEQVEADLDDEISRAVVVDAEGSTFDILQAFQKQKRVIVTPLKPSRMSGLELRYAPGSYFRPYRERGELRIARAVLFHKSTGRSLEIDALIVRRAHRKTDTILLTTAVELGMTGRDAADLYYQRWPLQENAFKEGGAVGLAEHRGNCGSIVSNVALVTKIERLEKQVTTAKETLARFDDEKAAKERARHNHNSAARELVDDRRRILDLSINQHVSCESFVQELRSHKDMHERAHTNEQTLRQAEAVDAKNEKRRPAVMAKTKRATEEINKLEPKKTIRKLDVALDSVLTAMKLAAGFLISFVLREYLSSMPMTTATFLTRLLSIRGRRELRPGDEYIVFYENPRDPEVNSVLREACAHLNKRDLHRDGRRLRYDIEAPPLARPP